MADLAHKHSEIAAMRPCSRELLVAVHDISKSYGRTTAVAGVTLTLWAGEICGFVGANGAGKTTALRMLAGILKPDSGGGHILGFGLQRETAEIRERVGYMSQRLSLYGELSVFENLRFRAAVYGLRNPRAAAEAALRDFNLVPWAHSPAASLSGGWARRLQLAASLLHAPQLVLLDEPTAGLDAVARQDAAARGFPNSGTISIRYAAPALNCFCIAPRRRTTPEAGLVTTSERLRPRRRALG
jgi:ABC-2 type transport system ATP-binding protein